MGDFSLDYNFDEVVIIFLNSPKNVLYFSPAPGCFMGVVLSSGDRLVNDIGCPFPYEFMSHINVVNLLPICVYVDLMKEPCALPFEVSDHKDTEKTLFPQCEVLMIHHLFDQPLERDRVCLEDTRFSDPLESAMDEVAIFS
jgi:hypothetical protein